jgi:AbiV family abortive infection protein
MIEAQRGVDPLELARAPLDNGDALLSDAAYLLADERLARAVALALMASEEFSKLNLCLNAITGEAEAPKRRRGSGRITKTSSRPRRR